MARTKKPKAMTRDTMIAMLRTRGVKGRLSKMTKPQLQKMVTSTAPAAAEHVEHASADCRGSGTVSRCGRKPAVGSVAESVSVSVQDRPVGPVLHL